jgi:pimeloyl-ACP methyl ester carboxylesterase
MQMRTLPPHQIHSIPYKEGQVCWHEFGVTHPDQTPLVLLHGGHGSWEHWARNIEDLSQYFQLLVPDMPGYGESAYFDSEFQYGVLDPLISTLNTLLGPDTSINLAGFSFGGFVSINLAKERKNIRKLALLGCAGHGSTRRPRGELMSWKNAYANQEWEQLSAIMRENLYRHMLSTYEAIDLEALRIHQDACIATRFRSKDISRAGRLAADLDQFAGQVLMIWGEHDVTCTPDELMERLIQGHPNRSIEIIKGAGHWVQYEAADQVNPLLVDWFK